jgi:hypothetical protein
MINHDYDAVSLQADVWKAVARSQLQRPDFNSRGAAIAFAKAVFEGKRKAEPAVEEIKHD